MILSNKKHYFSNIHSQKGSAIITVIVFITIILLYISTIFLYQQYKNRQIIKFGEEIQTYYNTYSVLSFALKEYVPYFQKKDYYSKTFNYSLFDKDSTAAVIEPWGYFLRAKCTSKIHNTTKQRTFLIGSKPDEVSRYAIVLGNTRNPLIVTGNTLITGDVAVGMQGVKPGVIKGKRYRGSTPVFGTINKDINSHLPKINFDLLFFQRKQIKKLYSKSQSLTINPEKSKIFLKGGVYSLNNEELIELNKAGINDIIGPGTLFMNSNMELKNINLYNQITLYSKKSILFSRSVKSHSILVFADKIGIDGSNDLQGQFYAENNFTITNGANLTYPSIAGIVSQKIWNKENIFFIGPNSEINGTILLANNLAEELGRKKHKLQINALATINGITYSDNYTELKGTIYGSVMTSVFHFYLSPTIYINWIKDAEINRPALNEKFTFPIAFEQDVRLTLLEEL